MRKRTGTDDHDHDGDDDDIVPSTASRPVFFFDVDNCVSKLQDFFEVNYLGDMRGFLVFSSPLSSFLVSWIFRSLL